MPISALNESPQRHFFTTRLGTAIVKVETINESAELEWLDKVQLRFRLKYTSSFYGSCALNGRLSGLRTRLVLDERSIVIETCEVKRGSSAALATLANSFMRKILLQHSSLKDADSQVWLRVSK